MNDLVIRPVGRADAATIAGIYNQYIRDTVVTFEEMEVSPDEMSVRIDRVVGDILPWLVAIQSGSVS